MVRYRASDESLPFGYIPDDDEDGDSQCNAYGRSSDTDDDGETENSTGSLIDQIEAATGYRFQNETLLEHSLTHSSIARTRSDSNERLEFLGDAILGAVVCEHLFHTFPEYPEGELTRIKSAVVSRHTCAKLSTQLRLAKFLRLGKGITIHEHIPSSILACAFESLTAAIYLDGGWDAAKQFLLSVFRDEVDAVAETAHGQNFKSQLQQLAQKEFGQTPVYRTLDEKGPDHSKCFQIAAVIGHRHYAAAWGPSKKIAEQNAARIAVEAITGGDSDS